jgi:hypothetical protein
MSVEFATFEDMLTSVQGLPAMPIAVIDADERHVLEGACEAAAAGYIDPILIGDEKSIRDILKTITGAKQFRIVHAPAEEAMAEKGVELFEKGEVKALMKGHIHTDEFLHPILFVGDKLEKGKLSLDRKKILNLNDIKSPMLLFASEGDNITPPQQALDWIIKVYGSVEEIKKLNKVIIYMIHPDVGHLGIFVGSKAAKKEHMEIIKSIDIIEALAPGLYEMVIVDKGKKEGVSDYDVRFVERDIKDLMALNADKEEMKEEDADFSRVAAISEMNDRLYNTFASPWVKMLSTETSAEVIKQLHPLRVNKYIFSDTLNPFMLIFKTLAPIVKKDRSPVSPDNPFTALEKSVSDSIVTLLDGYQNIRDNFDETMFFTIYENPWMKLLYPETSP